MTCASTCSNTRASTRITTCASMVLNGASTCHYTRARLLFKNMLPGVGKGWSTVGQADIRPWTSPHWQTHPSWDIMLKIECTNLSGLGQFYIECCSMFFNANQMQGTGQFILGRFALKICSSVPLVFCIKNCSPVPLVATTGFEVAEICPLIISVPVNQPTK